MGKIEPKFSLLIAILSAVVVTACNLPGSALVSVFGNIMTVGTFLFPLTFILFDLNTYFHGPDSTRKMIRYIVYSQIFLFLITWSIGHIANTDVYSMALRVITGSIVAFFVSSLIDTCLFSKMNTHLNRKKLWLSVNLSSVFSQLFDTAIFSAIVFTTILPTDQIIKSGMIILLIKIVSGLVLTPSLYVIKSMIEKTKN